MQVVPADVAAFVATSIPMTWAIIVASRSLTAAEIGTGISSAP